MIAFKKFSFFLLKKLALKKNTNSLMIVLNKFLVGFQKKASYEGNLK